jgi:hypothetical protein
MAPKTRAQAPSIQEAAAKATKKKGSKNKPTAKTKKLSKATEAARGDAAAQEGTSADPPVENEQTSDPMEVDDSDEEQSSPRNEDIIRQVRSCGLPTARMQSTSIFLNTSKRTGSERARRVRCASASPCGAQNNAI